jgi:hypothetical protein
MTDYAVSAVRYSAEGSLVSRVQLHEIIAGRVGPPLEVGRDQLVGAVETGRVVVAIRKEPTGRYEPHGAIRLVGIKGRCYLRCDGDGSPSDDLSGLPPF